MTLDESKSLICVSCPLNPFCKMRGASPCPKNGLTCHLIGNIGGTAGTTPLSEGKGPETHAYMRAISSRLDPAVTYLSFVLVPKITEDVDKVVDSQIVSILHPKLDDSTGDSLPLTSGGNDE